MTSTASSLAVVFRKSTSGDSRMPRLITRSTPLTRTNTSMNPPALDNGILRFTRRTASTLCPL